MPKRLLTALSLTFALAISGCKTVGVAVCPVLPPPPASLMQPPQTESRVRQILFEPPQRPTQPSAPSKKS